MIKIGKTILGVGVPRVAVSVGDRVASGVLRELRRNIPDVLELRIDRYASFEPAYVLNKVKTFDKFPTLATIRSSKEGGAWKGSEEKRLALFRALLPQVDAVDIELSSKKILQPVVRAARALKKPVVISYHNFTRTPSAAGLTRIVREAKSSGASIVKIAAMARSSRDVHTMAAFTLTHASDNLIVISMGRQGTASRFLFPALGSLLTYASASAKPGAPGQLDYRTTSHFLRTLYP